MHTVKWGELASLWKHFFVIISPLSVLAQCGCRFHCFVLAHPSFILVKWWS